MRHTSTSIQSAIAIFFTLSVYSQIQSPQNLIYKAVERYSCDFSPPAESFFETKFLPGSFSIEAKILPDDSYRNVTTSKKLLVDDSLKYFRIKLLGRKNKINRLRDDCYLVRQNTEGLSTLGKASASPVQVYKVFEWRNYSSTDFRKRVDLCKQLNDLLLSRTFAGAVVKNSFHNLEKQLNGINRELGGRNANDPIPLDNFGTSTMLLDMIKHTKEKTASELNKMASTTSKIKRVQEEIKNLESRYPVIRDTIFYISYFYSADIQAKVTSDYWFEIRNRVKQSEEIIPTTVTSANSVRKSVAVTDAPKFLICFAQGGACSPISGPGPTIADSVRDGTILSNAAVCERINVSPSFIDTLEIASQCNDMCNNDCLNFLEHLAEQIINLGLPSSLQGINNEGTQLCLLKNSTGTSCEIILGWWKNTEEELLCRHWQVNGTTVQIVDTTFNEIISQHVDSGYEHLILLGQSLGGKKLSDMVRDNWQWGDKIKLELMILWDATGLPLPGGVSDVGDKPEYILNFFQTSDADWWWEGDTTDDDFDNVYFQHGAHIEQADEEYDLTGCFSHNGIARSTFVHSITFGRIKETLVKIREEKRNQ